MRTRQGLIALLCLAALSSTGCLIRTGPKMIKLRVSPNPPIVRFGRVDVKATGSWAPATNETGMLKDIILKSLRSRETASYLSNDLANLVLDLNITMDHADDKPRLAELATWSIVSLGIIPLHYESVWDVRTVATLSSPDGRPVLRIPVDTAGTYDIWAMPWTPITLLGASFVGPHNARTICRRGTNNVSATLFDTIDRNYAALKAAKEAHQMSLSRDPIRAAAGGESFWVLYSIEHDQKAGADAMTGARHYVLELYTQPPAGGAKPAHALTIGDRMGAISTDTAWQWRDPKSVCFFADRAVWYPVCKIAPPHDALTEVEFKERRVTPHEAFTDAFLDALGDQDANDFLLAWKNRSLPQYLKEAAARDLADDADRIERMIVRLNERAEAEKDAAQKMEEKKERTGSEHVLKSRRLLSRIEILKAILQAVKAEATRRAG